MNIKVVFTILLFISTASLNACSSTPSYLVFKKPAHDANDFKAMAINGKKVSVDYYDNGDIVNAKFEIGCTQSFGFGRNCKELIAYDNVLKFSIKRNSSQDLLGGIIGRFTGF